MVSRKGDLMKNLQKLALALVIMLTATSAWAALGDGSGPAADQSVFVATINGQVFEMASARDIAQAALEQGMSLSDVVNGLGFAGASLDEIIGGALDFGTAPEAIAQVLVGSGYSSEQVVQAAMASGASPSVVDLFAAQAGVTPGQVYAAGVSSLSPIQGRVGDDVRSPVVSPY
jgi:hypothetical protein